MVLQVGPEGEAAAAAVARGASRQAVVASGPVAGNPFDVAVAAALMWCEAVHAAVVTATAVDDQDVGATSATGYAKYKQRDAENEVDLRGIA